MPPQANRRAEPIFASAGTCRRLFDLSPRQLAALRNAGKIHACKPTPKCWLYRVSDILAILEPCEDGERMDKEVIEDLAWLEAQLSPAASVAGGNQTTRKD